MITDHAVVSRRDLKLMKKRGHARQQESIRIHSERIPWRITRTNNSVVNGAGVMRLVRKILSLLRELHDSPLIVR
jgi:hypothetical protein